MMHDDSVSQPLVSIVTPSYNQGKFIEETIQSVLSQDYQNIEYIVMDGLSTDNTVDILKKYQDKLSWISEKDSGQASAINKGIKKSKGEIVAYLNSDDCYLPQAVTRAVNYLMNNEDKAFVYGKAHYTNKEGEIIDDYPTEQFNLDRLAENCIICQPSVFIRKKVLAEVGLFNESLYNSLDYDMWIKIGKKYQVGFLDHYIATSRLHEDTKTLSRKDIAIKESMRVSKKHFGYVGREWYLTLYKYYEEEVWNKDKWLHSFMGNFWKTLHEYHQNSRAKHPTYHYNPIGMWRYFLRKQKSKLFK